VELSAALFDEITGLGDLPPASDEAEHERRQHYRMPIGSRASIHPIVKGVEQSPIVGVIRDMSVGGVGMLLPDSVRQGDQFCVVFPGKGTRSIKLKCAAQRCEPGGVGGTQFIIGAIFLELIATIDSEPAPAAPAAPAPPPVAKPMPSRSSSIFAASSKPEETTPSAGTPEPSDAEPTAAATDAVAKEEAAEEAIAGDSMAEEAIAEEGIAEEAVAGEDLTEEGVAEETTPNTADTDAALEELAALVSDEMPANAAPAAPEEQADEFPDLAAAEMGIETLPVEISEDALMSALTDPEPSQVDSEVTSMSTTVISGVQNVSAPEPAVTVVTMPSAGSAVPKPMQAVEVKAQAVPGVSAALAGHDESSAHPSPPPRAAHPAKEAAGEGLSSAHPPTQATDALRIPLERRSPVAGAASSAEKNQEVLAKVKARLLNQNQVMQNNATELEKSQKQLAEQKALLEEARHQTSQLKAQYTATEQRWAQERDKLSQQLRALSAEAVLLKQQIHTLQLKSVSDDQAIAELSALLTGEAAPSPAPSDGGDAGEPAVAA
jgi:hypothetical protein